MRSKAVLVAAAFLPCSIAGVSVQCPGKFGAISASEWVKKINPGKESSLV
jgi:hypothetical protein